MSYVVWFDSPYGLAQGLHWSLIIVRPNSIHQEFQHENAAQA
ncbi:MAG: hypothetical protein O3C60_09380 [Planctomycetota bacterium]|nr:hypothetical protein [Planctomycetota bacterium]